MNTKLAANNKMNNISKIDDNAKVDINTSTNDNNNDINTNTNSDLTRQVLQKVREYLAAEKMSMSEFARQTGVSKAWLSKLKHTDANLSLNTAIDLLHYMGYTLKLTREGSFHINQSRIKHIKYANTKNMLTNIHNTKSLNRNLNKQADTGFSSSPSNFTTSTTTVQSTPTVAPTTVPSTPTTTTSTTPIIPTAPGQPVKLSPGQTVTITANDALDKTSKTLSKIAQNSLSKIASLQDTLQEALDLQDQQIIYEHEIKAYNDNLFASFKDAAFFSSPIKLKY